MVFNIRVRKFVDRYTTTSSQQGKSVDDSPSEEDTAAAAAAASQPNLLPTHCPTSMALLFVLVIEAVAVTVMECFIINYHTLILAHCNFTLHTLGLGQVDLIYHGIMIMSFVYQVFLYLDSLLQRNIFQLLTLLLYGVLLVVYTGIQTIQHMAFERAGCDLPSVDNLLNGTTTFPNSSLTQKGGGGQDDISNSIQMLAVIGNNTTSNSQDVLDSYASNISPFEYAILIFVPICFLILLGCMIKLYKLYRWDNARNHTAVSSDHSHLRITLIAWSILSGLLKLDFFFLFAYAVQLIPAKLMDYTILSFEGVLVFCFSLIALLIGVYGSRKESARLMWLFSIVLLGSIGYFGYRLFTFGAPRDVTRDPYILTRYSLLFSTLTLILLMIMTLCTCLVCIRNVSFYKVEIHKTFHCSCPTCYAYHHTK